MSRDRIRNIPAPASGTKAASYARFIPREELSSFAAWSPGALAGSTSPQNSGLRRASDREAASQPSASQDPVAQQRTARAQGYQDGYRDGLVALEEFKRSYAAQTTAQVGSIVSAVSQQMDALQQQMAQALAATATELARQIVRSELAERPTLVAAVAGEALDTLLLSARHITLRVHPDDHSLVAQGAQETLTARGARLLADAGVTRGGCVVESDLGVIDASIETRWRRAAAALGQDTGWTEGEPA